MRAIFLLLVAANLALFAWSRYYAAPDGASDPEPMRRQVSPEKIRLLAGKELAGLPQLKPRPIAETPSGAPAAGSCSEWGGFSVVGSSRVDLQACKLEYSIVSPK